MEQNQTASRLHDVPLHHHMLIWYNEKPDWQNKGNREHEVTWVASQIVLKLMKWLLTFSTPYFRIIVLSTNFPEEYKNKVSIIILFANEVMKIVMQLTNFFSFSLEHCGLICNTNFGQVNVWIKPLRDGKFKFL